MCNTLGLTCLLTYMIVIVDMVDVRDSPMPPQDSEIHDACESRHSATDDSDDNGRLNCGRLLAFQELISPGRWIIRLPSSKLTKRFICPITYEMMT